MYIPVIMCSIYLISLFSLYMLCSGSKFHDEFPLIILCLYNHILYHLPKVILRDVFLRFYIYSHDYEIHSGSYHLYCYVLFHILSCFFTVKYMSFVSLSRWLRFICCIFFIFMVESLGLNSRKQIWYEVNAPQCARTQSFQGNSIGTITYNYKVISRRIFFITL